MIKFMLMTNQPNLAKFVYANEVQHIVRINPINPRSAQEINAMIQSGADLIMLPMFNTYEEVLAITHIIDGRVPLILLVETPSAINELSNIIELPGITEIYIGLNDLSRALQLKKDYQQLVDTIECIVL